jgi:exosortase
MVEREFEAKLCPLVPMDSQNNSIEMGRVSAAGTRVAHLRFLAFFLSCLLPFALAWESMGVLSALVLGNETFSQIPLIPLVSFYLAYGNRKTIFSEVSYGWRLGLGLITPGIISLGAGQFSLWPLSSTNQVVLIVLGIVLIWMGMFAVFFGTRAFRTASFPLLFLLFTVPIPEPVLSKVIVFLQRGSADVAEAFFQLAHVPYFRQGFVFELPKVTIQVAEECSGIRSSLALLITTVLASHLILRSNWRRLLLILVVVPVAIFKNGLRIATLTILAIYVNPGFLQGNLHHRGGIVFFMIALLPMALLLRWLERNENPSAAVTKGA